MADHAILSASAAHRWINCPPSARLEQQFPNETSSYAAEGTFAHALAELKLSRAVANTVKPSTFKKKLTALQKDPFYSPGLEEYVDQYVAQVSEIYLASVAKCKDTLVLLEQRRLLPLGPGRFRDRGRYHYRRRHPGGHRPQIWKRHPGIGREQPANPALWVGGY